MNMYKPSRDQLDEALERLFDREMPPEEQDCLASELEHDPEALARFRDTTDILLALREPVSAPDVTDAVLRRMMPARRRAVRGRRLLSPGRVAVAAALLLAGVGLALLQQPGKPRTSPMATRSLELDPLVARILDPQLAQHELANLRADGAKPGPAVAMIHQRATLNAPPLVFELSPVQSLAGAGNAAADSPHQLVLDESVRYWIASDGSIMLEPWESRTLDIPTLFPAPRRQPIFIQIEPTAGSPWRVLPEQEEPDRMLLWPEVLELRLDLSEDRQSKLSKPGDEAK